MYQRKCARSSYYYYNNIELIVSQLINLLEVIQSDTKGLCNFESSLFSIIYISDKGETKAPGMLLLRTYLRTDSSRSQPIPQPVSLSLFISKYQQLRLIYSTENMIKHLYYATTITYAFLNNHFIVLFRKHKISSIVGGAYEKSQLISGNATANYCQSKLK